jgi:hypothetical protein
MRDTGNKTMEFGDHASITNGLQPNWQSIHFDLAPRPIEWMPCQLDDRQVERGGHHIWSQIINTGSKTIRWLFDAQRIEALWMAISPEAIWVPRMSPLMNITVEKYPIVSGRCWQRSNQRRLHMPRWSSTNTALWNALNCPFNLVKHHPIQGQTKSKSIENPLKRDKRKTQKNRLASDLLSFTSYFGSRCTCDILSPSQWAVVLYVL